MRLAYCLLINVVSSILVFVSDLERKMVPLLLGPRTPTRWAGRGCGRNKVKNLKKEKYLRTTEQNWK